MKPVVVSMVTFWSLLHGTWSDKFRERSSSMSRDQGGSDQFNIIPPVDEVDPYDFGTPLPKPGVWEENECGDFGNELIGPRGKHGSAIRYISSPNYPGNYPNRLNCKKIINVTSNQIARISFLDFELESSTQCWLDRLEIWRENINATWWKYGTFCGRRRPSLLTSRQPIKFIFASDRYGTYRGFWARLEYIPLY